MKPKHGLPCGVRLTEGLGGAGGATALAFAAETLTEPERRDTLSVGLVLTSRSVPELSLVRDQLASQAGVVFPAVSALKPSQKRDCLRGPYLAWCFAAGERLAEGRAATTRLTPSLSTVPAMALPAARGTDFPERSSASGEKQAVQSGRSDALDGAFHLAEFFAIATPNVRANRPA